MTVQTLGHIPTGMEMLCPSSYIYENTHTHTHFQHERQVSQLCPLLGTLSQFSNLSVSLSKIKIARIPSLRVVERIKGNKSRKVLGPL